MDRYALTLCLVLLVGPVHAASLVWEYDTTKGTIPSTATIQRSTTQTGTFSSIATVPSQPPTWTLPASPDNRWYRIQNSGGVSNVVQYTAAPPTQPGVDVLSEQVAALLARLTALEAAVAKLQEPAPAPSTNITAKPLNADQLEITGLNCTSLKTTGTGLQRIITCLH